MAKLPAPPRSRPQQNLPRDHDREGQQPYATEVEDYKQGVATPPEEQSGREANPGAKKIADEEMTRRAKRG
jgi:hypothetical protein